jgi:hypothetical protein
MECGQNVVDLGGNQGIGHSPGRVQCDEPIEGRDDAWCVAVETRPGIRVGRPLRRRTIVQEDSRKTDVLRLCQEAHARGNPGGRPVAVDANHDRERASRRGVAHRTRTFHRSQRAPRRGAPIPEHSRGLSSIS